MLPSDNAGEGQGNIRLSEAAEFLDALSESATLEMDRLTKVRWLLERVAPLVCPGLDYHVLLLDQIDRTPFPHVVDRVTFGPTFDLIEPRANTHIQALLDQCGPLCDTTVANALNRLRVPTTYIYSTDTKARWFTNVFMPQLLHPNRWQDCMACYWAGSPARLIIFNAFLPTEHAPFTADQAQRLSLACRAVAPVMDTDLFTGEANEAGTREIIDALNDLPHELHPLLLVVLQGQTPAQIAAFTGLLCEQVDIAIARLYESLGVKTRGELMARFVDRRVLAWLQQTI